MAGESLTKAAAAQHPRDVPEFSVLHERMPHLLAQSFRLHVEGTLSSGFSAVPPCNTTGKLFIEAGFKGGVSASFIEVIVLLSETEKTALCLHTLPSHLLMFII